MTECSLTIEFIITEFGDFIKGVPINTRKRHVIFL
jgi:hypothetical protein